MDLMWDFSSFFFLSESVFSGWGVSLMLKSKLNYIMPRGLCWRHFLKMRLKPFPICSTQCWIKRYSLYTSETVFFPYHPLMLVASSLMCDVKSTSLTPAIVICITASCEQRKTHLWSMLNYSHAGQKVDSDGECMAALELRLTHV